MKKILVVLFLLTGCVYLAQVANHEPGETLAHFRDVEKDTPSDYKDGAGGKTVCTESINQDIAKIMHEKYEDPGTCTLTAPWNGKTYLFRHDVLVNIEVNMRVSYNKAIGILTARYGKPVDRSHVVELRDHEVVNEKTYWHIKNFGVWALDMSYVSDQGDSGRYVSVIVEADSEHPPEKVNPNF
jgi:hypothetical protein